MKHKLIEIIQVADNLDFGKIYIAKNKRYYKESQIIDMIENDNYFFELQNKSTISTYLVVKTTKDGAKYLSTMKDSTKKNNLSKVKKYNPQNPP